MYSVLALSIVSLFNCNKNIYLEMRKCFKTRIQGIYIVTYIIGVLFLQTNSCASVSGSSLLQFALLNDCWRNKFFEKRELNTVKYWLSSQDGNKFEFCPGTHHFDNKNTHTSNFYTKNDFHCSLGICLYLHEPLNNFESDYSTKWSVKFRVLNNFTFVNLDDRPFILEDYLKVKHHEFRVFVKYLIQQEEICLHSLPYKLFYKFLGIIEVLDPISSKYLNQLYLCLLNKGLLGMDCFKIMSDPNEYKKKYLKQRNHSLMYFFLALDDSLDACLHKDLSCLSLFKKNDQLFDRGFRYIDTMSPINVNISEYIVEYIVKKFNREQLRIFNWLLYSIESTGFSFNKIEMTYVAIKISCLCDFGTKKLIDIERKQPNLVSSTFFELLSPSNLERISFLKFTNMLPAFESFVSIFKGKHLKYFEISECSGLKPHVISSLIWRNTTLEFLKLKEITLCDKDMAAILHLGLKTLNLNNCGVESDFNHDTIYNNLKNYKILTSLTSLDISCSKLPGELVRFLLKSQNIKYLDISSFELIPRARSKETFSGANIKWLSLKINNCSSNRFINHLAKSSESTECLVLSQAPSEDLLKFFFGLSNFLDTVTSLDISENTLSIEILNLLRGFKRIARLNVANSLPHSVKGLDEMSLFKTVEHLKVSGNKIGLNSDNFVARFYNLTKLDLSGANLQNGALIEIFDDDMLNSLIHLDLSSVNVPIKDFKKLCECKSLKCLYIDLKKVSSVSEYLEILQDANFKERLNFFCVETLEINILVFFKLISFPGLAKFRLVCEKFEETVENLQISNVIYRKILRIEIVYIQPLPYTIQSILGKAFQNYYISIVDNLSVCVS
ncbi:hypothetical protein CWI39_0932p0010 [Hamiltosporidium magnivora]|uniref:Leucine-rich repeat-containing protein n=1 Tax=Hamiltosporidium magnivora TaxID=148818 RepID=A0A4Q9LA34_9MICR|nr:hypothetical protein CWI39_0932p0010 [Hamiltosporidium magnivora]